MVAHTAPLDEELMRVVDPNGVNGAADWITVAGAGAETILSRGLCGTRLSKQLT